MSDWQKLDGFGDRTTSATKGKAARELVHEALDGQCGENWVRQSGHHDPRCDRLTAAIEADRSQQAAIHEEEPREARAALFRFQDGDGTRAQALRLKMFQMLDAREVASAAGFTLTTEAKAKLYDIQQDIIRAAIAADDRSLGASQQTETPPCPSYCSFPHTGNVNYCPCDPGDCKRCDEARALAPAGSGTPPADEPGPDEDGDCRICGLPWPNISETEEPHECPPGFRRTVASAPAGSGTPPADIKKREPGCRCHREEGDSACPIHDAPSGSGTAETCGTCRGLLHVHDSGSKVGATAPCSNLACKQRRRTCPDCGGSGTTKGDTKR